MVVALFALSLAMIVGGLFAVVLGWDIVLLERGWTMVIAGSVSAGSGAVVLGLAVAASRLGRIRAELVELRDALRFGAMPTPPALDPVAAVSSGMLAGAAMGAAPAAAADAEGQPELPLFMRPEATSRDELPSETMPGEAPRISLPEGLFGARRRAGSEDDTPSGRDDDRLSDRLDSEDRFGAAPVGRPDDDRSDAQTDEDRPSLRPYQAGPRDGFLSPDRPAPPEVSVEVDRDRDEDRGRGEGVGPLDDDEPRIVPLWDAGDRPNGRDSSVLPDPDDDLPDPPPRAPALGADSEPDPERLRIEDDQIEEERPEEERLDDEPLAAQPAAIIGTYNSGDNRYVMFSDGSIEAETPEGLFRFASLDELKEFIAAGGESRGA